MELILQGNSAHLGSRREKKYLSNIFVHGIQLHRKVCQLKYVESITSNVKKKKTTETLTCQWKSLILTSDYVD